MKTDDKTELYCVAVTQYDKGQVMNGRSAAVYFLNEMPTLTQALGHAYDSNPQDAVVYRGLQAMAEAGATLWPGKSGLFTHGGHVYAVGCFRLKVCVVS